MAKTRPRRRARVTRPAQQKGRTSAREVIRRAGQEGAKIVDLRFVDVPGLWQHFSIPVRELTEELFEEGIGFDGSSIRGFQTIDESDMLLMPDPATAVMDPFTAAPTLTIICNVKDPITGEAYTRDPRYVAQKAENHLRQSGLADTVYIGPELEFFFLDAIRFDQTYNCGYYYIDSEAGFWNSGKEGTPERPNLGYKPRYKQGYFPVPPMDKFQDIRSDMVLALESVGVRVEVHHHEVATAGQTEVDMRFNTLTRMADSVMWYKYCAKNTARRHGKTATFMPKPIFQDNGSGMHTHQSLWKRGKNLFYEPGGYADISEMCLWYIGGILKHAPALCALIAPTTNSYRRLVPGYEAPINLVYSQRNRSACVRIPMYSRSEKAKRIEFRTPDPSCNPYLSFAACLMAGLDGVANKTDPGKPIDKDLYELEPEEARRVKQLPGSLDVVLDALEADHDFLLKGDVFTPDLIETWIDYKRKNEVDPIRLRPHPWEFALYFDI
jgi:glutamine synthetase